ncbi:NepR family anti-sigma factor [Aureimonas sp. ME7]|uniref:NepR family anti-sigma factor n=1 Tax=Aureimonas sp. ME7 TaxID=2744252 RepID=UPI0015F6C184|nr:NepR family anti-sigma factor [Aureimonas sp. ME7]
MSGTSPDTSPSPSQPEIGQPELGTSSAIGRRLKAYYDDVASEPVPDRFLSLLDALDAAEAKRDGGN